MNIRDQAMWPVEDVPEQTAEAWTDLLNRRRSTFLGFCELERRKGFLSPPTSLAMPAGQEMARLLMFRCIEEFVESIDSESEDHKLEELIDSLNYAMGLLLLDPESTPVPLYLSDLRHVIWYGSDDSVDEYDDEWSDPPSVEHLAHLTYNLVLVTDQFRNRAWMENAQDVYFAGRDALVRAVIGTIHRLLEYFPDWETFWRFFVAKDNVLQFRLRTGY